jgi:hypothetical protein
MPCLGVSPLRDSPSPIAVQVTSVISTWCLVCRSRTWHRQSHQRPCSHLFMADPTTAESKWLALMALFKWSRTFRQKKTKKGTVISTKRLVFNPEKCLLTEKFRGNSYSLAVILVKTLNFNHALHPFLDPDASSGLFDHWIFRRVSADSSGPGVCVGAGMKSEAHGYLAVARLHTGMPAWRFPEVSWGGTSWYV